MSEHLPRIVRIAILGQPQTGKSSLINNYTQANWHPVDHPTKSRPNTTAETDSSIQTLTFRKDDIQVEVQIWNLQTIETFSRLPSILLKRIHAFILTYNITDRSSYLDLDYWMERIDLELDSQQELNTAKYAVGTHLDMAKYRQVTEATARSNTKLWCFKFIELSTKDPSQINSLFTQLFQ